MLKETAQRNFTNLQLNTYPGRGIIIGETADSSQLLQIYWIMGRSENSRNRIFVKDQDNSVRTQAHDPAKCKDPSLVIYTAVKTAGDYHIISNGDQTDTIDESILAGGSFETALCSRLFEPDEPNFTPRISGIINVKTREYKLAIIKTISHSEQYFTHQFFNYNCLIPGYGYYLATYEQDGTPLPSFSGEPQLMPLRDTPAENLRQYWDALNAEHRVALLVKQIDKSSGVIKISLMNKHG